MSKRRKRKVKSYQEVIPAIILPDEPSKHLPQINVSKLYQLFLQGEHGKVCEAIIKVLNFFEIHNYRDFDLEAMSNINNFVAAVFAIMSNPDFKILTDKYALTLMSKAHIFANLVHSSAYGTTDSLLSHILCHQGNFVKLLFLYTSRNSVHIPVKQLFDINARYASMWYFTYILPTIGQVTSLAYANLQQHIKDMDDRYILGDHRLTPLYFASTYLNDEDGADKRVKEILNREAQKVTAQIKVTNTPKRDSLALVTAKWFENSAVYKSSAPLIERLRKRYKLTLIHVGSKRPETLITDMFDTVHYMQFDKQGVLETNPIEANDFQLAYFPDIGMNDESIWLSNFRWAPIQVTSYGHPVSTFGGEIDYFIAGSDSEVHEDLRTNYSERVVLIPGIGAHPTWPNYKPTFPEKRSKKMIVNCVWGPDKYTWPIIQFLQNIAEESHHPVEFQFFCSRGVHRYQGFLPFKAEVKALLTDAVKVHADKEYFEYMKEAEYADFALNSWPFGGYNTVVEALYLRKPVVTLEGKKFYNKAGACLLRKVGLDDLVAQTIDQFTGLTLRMLNDPDFLREKQEHLRGINLQEILFNTDEPAYFEKAIEYLIDNHDQLQNDGSRSPIIIGEDL
jgi:predicted O-linked N-acetylglucosamine transferase (SPINDLY family)